MGDPIDPDYTEVCQRWDTCLTTEDGTVFHVNSELLSKHSTFFNSLFLMGEEAGQNTVIHDVKPDILQIILSYMSTGEVLLTTENILYLLVASDFLMIQSLLDECRKFVLRDKKVENLVSYFLTANRIKGLDLEVQCRRFLVLCFEKAVMHSMDEACNLPYEELKYFLSHRSLNVSHERTIWWVIEAWVQKDPVNRHPLVPGLLRCLSIHEMGEELVSNLLSSPIIRKNIYYRDVEVSCAIFVSLSDLLKAHYIILFRNELPIISDVRLPPFLHVVAKLSQDGGDRAELHVSYDDSLDLWRKVGDISLKGAEKILVSAHLVFYLERVEDGHYELSGFYYDLLRNEEKRMAPSDCIDYVVVEVRGCVYAVEMFGSTIKRYIYETDEWTDVRRIRHRGCIAEAQNVNGLLHVLGDVIGRNRMFMLVYYPSKDEWGRVPSPTVRRCFAKSAVYQGKIFLVAGHIEVEESDDDEEDDDEDFADDRPDVLHNRMEEPDGSDDSDEGEERNPDDDNNDFEDVPPDVLQAINNNNMEEAMNNIEQNESISKAVEVYDPESKEWSIYPELPFRFSPACVSVVKDRLYVYENPQRPVTYWDGSGQWKIVVEDSSRLFQHKFGAVKDVNVVSQIMKRNKEVDPTVWLETGLEKVIP